MKARRTSSCKRSPNSSWSSSLLFFLALLAVATTASAQSTLHRTIDERIATLEQEMLGWRRHFHEHPELSNREVETSKYVADRLRSFGLEPKVGVGRHGSVATLRGGPSRTRRCRARRLDRAGGMKRGGLVREHRHREFEGRSVPVMHACGHDAHMAMLLATAKILSGLQPQLRGTVTFIFQPAEEGAPTNELPAGADLMVREGALKSPDVDAVFGVHVFANIPSGHIGYRSGPLMAASDQYEILVRGRQTHGANPWNGVDPIVVGSQIVLGLQTIVSRQVDITAQPAIITVGQFESGVRNNIIPDTARLVGTIRTFDESMRKDIHERITRTAQRIAESAGATATVSFGRYTPVTVNHPALTRHVLPTLQRVTNNVFEVPLFTTSRPSASTRLPFQACFVLPGDHATDQSARWMRNHCPVSWSMSVRS